MIWNKRSDVEVRYRASEARIVEESEDKTVRRDKKVRAKKTFTTERRVTFEEMKVEPMSTTVTNVEPEDTICNKEGSNMSGSTDGNGESDDSVNVEDSASVSELLQKWSKQGQKYGYRRVLRSGKSGARMDSIRINYICQKYRQRKGFNLDGVYRGCAANALVKKPLYQTRWIVVRRSLHSDTCRRTREETAREKNFIKSLHRKLKRYEETPSLWSSPLSLMVIEQWTKDRDWRNTMSPYIPDTNYVRKV